MRKYLLGLLSAATLIATPVAMAGPLADGVWRGGDVALQDVQYIWGGRRYCWYYDGWRGPGWYWCGYRLREGFGWGGGWGWRGWHYRGDYRGGFHGHGDFHGGRGGGFHGGHGGGRGHDGHHR